MSKKLIVGILAGVAGFVTLVGIIFMTLTLTGSISLLKNSITITSESYEKEYDGEGIDVNRYDVLGKLYEGDRVSIEFYDQGANVGTYTTYFEAKILNKDDKDVTESYNITKNYGTVTITKREITLRVKSEEEEYDGNELKATDYEIVEGKGSLAEGDILDVTLTGSITEIGEAKASLVYKVYSMKNGEKIDVTSNYKVVSEDGILTKAAIPLTIKSDGGLYEYDGKYHQIDTYTTPYLKVSDIDTDPKHTEHLAEGDTISYTPITNEKNVGNYINDYEVVILDGEGNDVTKNYSLDLQYGDISIIRKEITVVSENIEKEYDDETYVAQGNSNYSLDGSLADGDLLKVTFTQVATSAGSYDNTFYTAIYDADNKIVSNNYIVNHVYGTIVVLPRPITISTRNYSKIYDGEILENQEEPEVSPATPQLSGHMIYAVFSDGITDAGEVDNYCSITIKNAQGNDVTRNYQMTLDFGKLKVIPRELTIRASSYSKAEDGLPIVSDSWNLVQGKMAPYEYLNLTTVGTTRNLISYSIVNMYGQILTQAQNNYNIKVLDGILTIYEAQNKPIYLAPKDVYSKYVDEDTTITPTEIIGFDHYASEGYTIEYVLTGSQTGMGTSVSRIIKDSIRIKDSSNVDVTAQFTIDDDHLFTGILQIYEKEITIITSSLEEEYDGMDHTTILSPTITGADDLDIDYEIIGSQKNVGTSMNKIKINGVYESTDTGHLNNIMDHYYIHITLGVIKVNPHTLIINTPSANGSIAMESSISAPIDEDTLGLPSGHHIIQSNVVLDYIGSKQNAITVIIVDEDGNDVTYNYDITYNYGTLTLTN